MEVHISQPKRVAPAMGIAESTRKSEGEQTATVLAGPGFVAVAGLQSPMPRRPRHDFSATPSLSPLRREPMIIRRTSINFRNPSPPPDTLAKDTDTMTVADLDQVVKDGKPIYTEADHKAAIDARIGREIAAIKAEAVVFIDTLNDPSVATDKYSEAVQKIFDLHKSVMPRLIKALQGKAPADQLKKIAEDVLSTVGQASLESRRGLTESGGEWKQSKVTKDPAADPLKKHIGSTQIKFVGAKGFSNHLAPTAESKSHVADPGIAALQKFCGISAEQLHWVVNALLEADREKSGSDIWKRWSDLLTEMALCWTEIKPASAKDWTTKALLPTGTKLATHYLGMFAELAEAHKIITSGQLLPGTQLTLGKVKKRDKHPAMKKAAPEDQDVDISFHHKGGTRHYVEVKADPATIVDKIGEDEKKKELVDDSLKVSDPDLASTPDQVLSYANAKKTHEAKVSKKGRYATGKKIVLTYSTRKTKNWLCIFTSKAALRLITHGFELQLADCRMDGPTLLKVQDYVTRQTATMSKPDKESWVATQSATSPEDFIKSLT